MNFFKDKVDKKPDDVKIIRENILLFIKEQLGKLEGGEGKNIKGLNLFISANNEEKHIYESAVYLNTPDLFKTEVQRIADDYAIGMPQTWAMDIIFVDESPSEAMPVPDLN
nr:FHA domain-containing protein [Chitinophagaceae bacterium]